MKAHAQNAVRVIITTRRFLNGKPGPAVNWEIHFMPPRTTQGTPAVPQG
jgi:hypothetical protein